MQKSISKRYRTICEKLSQNEHKIDQKSIQVSIRTRNCDFAESVVFPMKNNIFWGSEGVKINQKPIKNQCKIEARKSDAKTVPARPKKGSKSIPNRPQKSMKNDAKNQSKKYGEPFDKNHRKIRPKLGKGRHFGSTTGHSRYFWVGPAECAGPPGG